MLKSFKWFFPPSSISTQHRIMTKWKQDLKMFCKCIKKLKLKHHFDISIQTLFTVFSWSAFGSDYSLRSSWVWRQQALHTWMWGFSAILLCRSPLALSGWMGTIGGQPFSGLSRDVWLAGPLKDIHKIVPMPLLHCLCCVLRVIVLSECEPSAQSEVLSILDQVFIKDIPRSAFPKSWPVPQSLPL